MPLEYPRAQQQIVDSWETLVDRGDNQHVSVNHQVLDDLAETNPTLSVPDWRFPGHPADDWAFATQALVSSVINFAFLNNNRQRDGENWQMTDEQGQVLVGSDALHSRLYDRFGERADITGSDIYSLAMPEEFEKFLPSIPMAAERRTLLCDFAHGVERHYDGLARNILEYSRDDNGNLRLFNNGDGLVERLTDRAKFGRAFMDTSYLSYLTFPFNKRANLAPVLIYGRSTTSDTLPTVADIDDSGAIPDYRLPQAFRAMGAIEYSDYLSEQVAWLNPIPPQSPAEIEIRAATSYSTAYLLQRTNQVRAELGEAPYNMAHIDFWLWKMGRELKKQPDTQPPHYTRTTAY